MRDILVVVNMAKETRDYIEKGIEVTFAFGSAIYLISRFLSKQPVIPSETEINKFLNQTDPDKIAAVVENTPFQTAGESLYETFDRATYGYFRDLFEDP